MISDDAKTSEPPKHKQPGPGLPCTFKCDVCRLQKLTGGRRLMRGGLWRCAACVRVAT